MKGRPRQWQFPFEFARPSGLDKSEIKLFVRSINFIAHNRVTNGSQMHADLMSSSGARDRANQAEFVDLARIPERRALSTANGLWSRPTSRSNELSLDPKFSLRRRSSRVNRLLQPDLGFFVFTLSI